MKNKGVSPVIATVLLIAMVIVIALIIFLWFKGIGGETILKFGRNVELACDEVGMSLDYNNGNVYLSNTGNVPIFSIKVKVETDGSHKTYDLTELNDDWGGLTQGQTFSSDIGDNIDSGATALIFIPVLMGSSNSGEKTYVCDENQFGYKITI